MYGDDDLNDREDNSKFAKVGQ